jgi:outer membrane protein OmpA-like peptidoglycan-associated protein/tetratricopeptide (TPR) repeat protein
MNQIKATIILLLLPILSFAQYDQAKLEQLLSTASEQELVTESSQMIQEGYLYQAGLVTDKLLEKKPQSSNYNYRRGFIYMEMSQDFIRALPLLEIAVKDIDKNFDAFSTNETSAPTDALYHLAHAYHMSENIDKAEEYYNKFLAQSNPKSEFIYFAKLGLEQCVVARKLISTPKKVTLANVGSTINSNQPEYSPVISLDGSAIYFTSRRAWEGGKSDKGIDPRYNLNPEDIYVSYRDFDGEWTEPARMEFCNPIQNEATMAVSADERRIYVYEDTVGSGDIFYSDFSTNRFQNVMHLEERQINTASWETHCTVTPDGQTMYFVSDRKGGFGGRDIYRTVKLPDGSWSNPLNCGPKINSEMDEDSPFIAVDNKTLYFSSNGPRSMGGFDVFVAVRDENNEWSDAINLGYPLNSTGDDLFYTTTVDGLTGYLTSFRKDGYGEKDIYQIKNDYLGLNNLAVLKGRIHTYDGKPLPENLSVKLRCTNCGDAFDRKVFPRMRDGVFISSLEPCRDYEMIFSFEGGAQDVYTENFTTECNQSYQEIIKDIWLDTENGTFGQPYLFQGTISDSKSKQLLENVKVTIVDKQTARSFVNSLTTDLGFYTSDTLKALSPHQNLLIEVRLEKEGYVTMSYDVSFELTNEMVIDMNQLITPLLAKFEVGNDIGFSIKPIYFDYNKADIRPDAAAELDKIVRIMKDNPNMKIELGSHTDSRGTEEDNLDLSAHRAKSAAAYIVSKGIHANRIHGHGYGESKLKVSDAEIAQMPSDLDKVAAHQLNRRTEFLIMK